MRAPRIYLAITTLAVVLVAGSPALWHWSTVPALLCALVSSVNLERQLRRGLGRFNPRLWVEAFSIHFFGFAPLLHVALGYYGSFSVAPDDWLPIFGAMSLVNLAGLLVRTLIWDLSQSKGSTQPRHRSASLPGDFGRAFKRVDALIALSAAAFIAVVLLVGGPIGYLRASGDRLEGFQGLGSLVLISDLLPSAVLLKLATRIRAGRSINTRAIRSLIPLMVLQLMLGGLRGSRIQLVFFGLLALGILHWAGRTVSRRFLVTCVAGALAFSFGYGFYKDIGPALLETGGRNELRELEASGDRGLPVLLLGDLGRSNVQALLWQEVGDPQSGFQPLGGRTYASDALAHVPSFLRPTLPGWSKVEAGTSVLVPEAPADFNAGYIYGAAGEAMLNFGRGAALPALIIVALLSAPLVRWSTCPPDDARSLMYPSIIILLVTAFMSDLDQLMYMSLRFVAAPLAVYTAFPRVHAGSEGGIDRSNSKTFA